MKELNLNINGRACTAKNGESILTVARREGFDIPTLCHVPGLAPEGGCRLCLVEVAGKAGPAAACHELVKEGYSVRTDSKRLAEVRREVVDAHQRRLEALPLDERNAICGGRTATEFADLLREYGLASDIREADSAATTHPYLSFDPARCIVCRRCVRVCDDVQGQFVFNVAERGNKVRLTVGNDKGFQESGCVACGACVDICPTGAIFDRDGTDCGKIKELSALKTTHSVCGYCGVGCNIDVESDGSRVYRVRGTPSSTVNQGHLCAKGRYAHTFIASPDRLTQPLLRSGREWREIDWTEAVDWVVNRMREIRKESGADSLGAFTSSRSTNEAAYLLQKLFRTVVGTNNIDCCARVCHSSTALGLRLATGAGAASASYQDIEKASVIVIAGANPTEAHPVVGARIKQAVRRGTPLIVIDPRRIELAEYAQVHLPLRPGTNVALFNSIAKLLIERNYFDDRFVRERADGFDVLEEFVMKNSIDSAAATCGINADLIVNAAELLGDNSPCLFVHGLGLSELSQGTGSVMALANLGILTGSIGRPGAGMLPLRGQNNVQGNADMGAMPNLVTGYQALHDPETRKHLTASWSRMPPAEPGKTIPEMIDAAVSGEICGLWIQGEDIVQSDPNQAHVLAAVKKLDLLVVQELFMSETAQHAHLILPAACSFEQEGTFTNGERRIQHVVGAVNPPGLARADWDVIQTVAQAFGASWNYQSPADVMDEVAQVAPHLFGGVSYDRLGQDGLQWPCPHKEHAGTATVHEQGFIRGKALLTAIDHKQSPEETNDTFPYLLITGRVLHHYNVGTMTRRTRQLELTGSDVLELCEEDASDLDLNSGDEVGVTSRYGAIRVAVEVSSRIKPGTMFLAFHFPETATNRLTSPFVDPDSKCPEYKLTAIRID